MVRQLSAVRRVGSSWGKEARVSGTTGGALSHTRKNSPLQLRQRPSASTDQFPHHQHRTQRKRQVRLGLQKLLEDSSQFTARLPVARSSSPILFHYVSCTQVLRDATLPVCPYHLPRFTNSTPFAPAPYVNAHTYLEGAISQSSLQNPRAVCLVPFNASPGSMTHLSSR